MLFSAYLGLRECFIMHGVALSQLVIGNELTPFLAAVNDAVFAHRIYSPLTI